MYRLYGALGTGSGAVEAALAEAGADYEVVTTNTKEGAHLTEEFRRINPRQQVPALELPDGTVVTETAALLMHIADAFPDAGLAPKPGTSARALHDRWLVFMAVNIYEGELRHYYPDRYSDDAASVAQRAVDYVERNYGILEEAIVGPFLLGDRMTMADIFLWTLSSWMDPKLMAERFPKIFRLASAVRNRPKIAPIHAAHCG
jgi:glutathione S-transferase